MGIESGKPFGYVNDEMNYGSTCGLFKASNIKDAAYLVNQVSDSNHRESARERGGVGPEVSGDRE